MRVALIVLVSILAAGHASAAKPTRFWNLTANTVTKLEMAPSGTDRWGEDQAKNDKDGSVDHDERLKVTGVTTGTYDVRLSDSKGRACLIKNVAVKEGDVFSIDEKQMTNCGK
jgi:hypothetical protein